MRKIIVSPLLFLSTGWAGGDTPKDWKALRDSKGACQIAVPPNWILAPETGSAYPQDPSVGIAVVTSQPAQAFKPISDTILRLMNVPKENVFENSSKLVFYQDRQNPSASDSRSLNVMVPGNSGTCSAHVVTPSSVPEDTAKKIALSLSPVTESAAASH